MTYQSGKMDGILPIKSLIQTLSKNEENQLRNVHSSSDFNAEYALKMNRWQLKSLGLWPLSSKPYYIERILPNIKITICSLLMAFVIVPGCFLTFFKIKNSLMRLQVIGVLSFCVMSIMKYYFLILNRHHIAKCIDHLMSDWRRFTSEFDQKIMFDHAKYGRYGATMCIIFIHGGGIFYTGILPLLTVTKDETNVTIRPLAYPSYYGWFDPQLTPTYEIIYVVHFCSTLVMLSITSVACGIAAVFVMHVCGQIEIMMAWLRDILQRNKNFREAQDKISIIIQQHVYTLKFTFTIEKLFHGICLVEVVGSALNICLLGYYIILEWDNKDTFRLITYALILSSFILNIFLFCYIGELLTQKCNEVGEATYMIEWYRLSPNLLLNLIPIIQTAQRPVFLTAGKLINLSINTFGTIIKTSVTYLNLLWTFVR